MDKLRVELVLTGLDYLMEFYGTDSLCLTSVNQDIEIGNHELKLANGKKVFTSDYSELDSTIGVDINTPGVSEVDVEIRDLPEKIRTDLLINHVEVIEDTKYIITKDIFLNFLNDRADKEFIFEIALLEAKNKLNRASFFKKLKEHWEIGGDRNKTSIYIYSVMRQFKLLSQIDEYLVKEYTTLGKQYTYDFEELHKILEEFKTNSKDLEKFGKDNFNSTSLF